MFKSKTDEFRADQRRAARMFKALSHPARLAILEHLAKQGTCICGDLVSELPLAQASVSRHLKTLKEAGLITGEVDGPRSCYCLDVEAIAALRDDANTIFAGIRPRDLTDDCC
ncbi:MAG: winged helix-turn-helix transcriptional regulator [Rhodothermales bacterium]|nr:winged helix-turn-helix transcriptional regulator [Rhodothermales bacterium]